MALSRKLMMDGEQTVATTRTHVKVLFVPLVILLAVAFAGGFLAAQVGNSGDGYVRWVIIGIAVVLVLWGSVLPFVRWFLWTYTLTNKRIVEQKGILTREGRVIPLSRINDVSFEKNLNDRILGCGT
ncbi:MAG: PH domain-containing protein, partial [Actinomycetales bacterium]